MLCIPISNPIREQWPCPVVAMFSHQSFLVIGLMAAGVMLPPHCSSEPLSEARAVSFDREGLIDCTASEVAEKRDSAAVLLMSKLIILVHKFGRPQQCNLGSFGIQVWHWPFQVGERLGRLGSLARRSCLGSTSPTKWKCQWWLTLSMATAVISPKLHFLYGAAQNVWEEARSQTMVGISESLRCCVLPSKTSNQSVAARHSVVQKMRLV